jgi:arabinose-5-phosphate isomerase
MLSGSDIPLVHANASVADALLEISKKGLGMTGVIAADGTLTGVFTDGDLRRILDARVDVHSATVEEVMTKGGKTTTAGQLAVEALNLMETHKISALMVTDDKRKPVGAFNMHMLLKAGVL